MSMYVVNARLDIQKLLKNLVISLGTGVLTSFLAGDPNTVYTQLGKPAFALPSFLFPMFWTILYIAMGIAAYVVDVNSTGSCSSFDGKPMLKLYYLHLLFNFLWPIFFFSFGSPVLALVDMILLFVLAALVTFGFAKCSRSTLIFMGPYMLWLLYEMILNISLL